MSAIVPGFQKLQMTWLNPVCHRILYSRTHMATVGVKGLIHCHRNEAHCTGVCVPYHVAAPITVVANHRLEFESRLIGWCRIPPLINNTYDQLKLILHRKDTALVLS